MTATNQPVADPCEPTRRRTEQGVARYAAAGPEAIDRRLGELDREWDAGRVLEAGATAAVLAGVALGTAVDRRLLALPVVAGGLLLLHAAGGWCPPVRLSRRLGCRTAAEIQEERSALKALRGDFRDLPRLADAADRADLARFEGEGGRNAEAGAEDAHDRHDRAAVDAAFRAARR